jgi:ribosome maturation factor RimP
MRGSPLEQKILNLITPVVDDLGYDIVQLRVLGSQKMQTLQILAEDPKTGLLDLKGCEVISRAVSAHLDVEDPIAGAYQLEVSSPGLDRPLTRVKDFENFAGLEASIETEIPAPNGQKKYRGRLKGINDNVISIETDEGMAEIEFNNIAKARLIVNNELLTMKNPKGQKKVLNPKPTKKASNTKSKSEK